MDPPPATSFQTSIMAKNPSIPSHGRAAAVEAQANHLYNEGLHFHHQGDLAKAAAAYEQVLKLVPKHAEALHHVGIIAFQEGNHDLAAGFFRAALAQNPNMAGVHCDLGNVCKEQKRFDEALQCYDKALALAPNDADAYYNRGVALQAMGRNEEAVQSYDRALALSPEDAQAHNNRGVALNELKQHDAALASFERALGLWPDFFEAHNNRGNAYREKSQFEEALACFDRAIELNPRFADAHSNRGIALQGLGRTEDAIESYGRALRWNPESAEAYHNRAITYFELERWELALKNSQQAIRLRPDYREAYSWLARTLLEMREYEAALKSFDVAVRLGLDTAELHERRSAVLLELKRFDEALRAIDRALAVEDLPIAYCSRGSIYLHMEQYSEAQACYEQALAKAPDMAEAHQNLALVLGHDGQIEAALASFAKALAIDPDLHLARWNRALMRLRHGDLLEGWRDYEARWKTKTLEVYRERSDFAQPLWLGEAPLEGKTILLHSEQGIGDTLQMCRYVAEVAQLGARIVLRVQSALPAVLAGLPGVVAIVQKGDPLPAFDYHCPMMSLPLAFKTTVDTIPAAQGYLAPDPVRVAHWQARLGARSRPRVGVVWSGSAGHKGDRHRSIALADFATLVGADCEFIALQKEVRAADQAVLDGLPQLRFVGDQLHDMADTAALCSLMDLVITVDTSVAHLAGAIGKPTWILLQAEPDWRWMLERSDSPWYSSVTLYRQPAGASWQPVLEKVDADLRTLAAT